MLVFFLKLWDLLFAEAFNRVLDGIDDAQVPCASADVSAQLKLDTSPIGVGETGDNVVCSGKHARRTKPALQSVTFGETTTNNRHRFISFVSFDRSHFAAFCSSSERQARANG